MGGKERSWGSFVNTDGISLQCFDSYNETSMDKVSDLQYFSLALTSHGFPDFTLQILELVG